MITVLIIVTAVITLVLLLLTARGTGPDVSNAESINTLVQTVDLAAFRNLISREEEEYLRVNLPPSEFRRIRRARQLAAIAYLKTAARNAAVLLRLAESARSGSDPEIARAAEDLVDSALQMRIYAMLAIVKFYAALMLPRLGASAVFAAEKYQSLTRSVVHFVSLSRPNYTSRISASL